MLAAFEKLLKLNAVTAPVPANLHIHDVEDAEVVPPPPIPAGALEPISGFACFIDYEDLTRPIVCRRFDIIGDVGYVAAICHAAKGYRQFRTDRILAVYDAITGEAVGDGEFFWRFEVNSTRERARTWGLSPSQKATLVAGLNVLSFMARCDGRWHPLEREPVEAFVCSMWLRKEWPNEPPIREILHHAERLTPDSETFFRGLSHYAQSSTSTTLLRRAVAALIEADGVIADAEFEWGMRFDSFFQERNDKLMQALASMAHEATVIQISC
jgi:hypothetical protein